MSTLSNAEFIKIDQESKYLQSHCECSGQRTTLESLAFGSPFNSRMLAKYFLLAAFCAVAANSVLGANLIDKETCGKGQVYWCGSLVNAKRCNAVKHCIYSVWEYQILPKDIGDTCNTCKDMVSWARAQLTVTATQEELKQVLEDACKLNAEKIVFEKCFEFVDDYTTELAETLASQMKSQVICSVVGLCDRILNDELLAENNMPISPLLPAGQTIPSKAELIQFPLRTDEHMTGGWKEEGFGRKDTHSPRVTVDTDSPASINIPDATHMEELNKPILSHNIRKRSDEIDMELYNCSICLSFVPMINDLWKENYTAEEVKQKFHSACDAAENLQKACNEFVGQYTYSVISLLAKTTDPQDVCSALPVCGFTSHHKGVSSETPASTKMTCYYCIGFMPVIDRMWKVNYTAEIIKHSVHIGCNAAQSMQKECNALVDHIDSVVSLLDKDMDPDDVCSAISVCSSENDQQPNGGWKNRSIKTDLNTITFILCLSLVYLIDKMWKENHIAEESKKKFHSTCNSTHELQKECNEFVDQYTNSAISILAKNMDLNDVCSELSKSSTENDQQLQGGSAPVYMMSGKK